MSLSRYHLEVEELDRKHRLRVRAATFVAAAGLAVLALWSAGVRPIRWLASMRAQAPANSAPADVTVAPLPAAATTQQSAQTEREPLRGLDSSVAARPQPLYLMATAPGQNVRHGTARIGTAVDNPQTYVAGAMLANGAALAEIYQDRVVLERGRERVTLRLADKGNPSSNRPSEDETLAWVGGEQPSQPASIAPTQAPVTQQIRAMPYYEDGVAVGVQVFPGERSSAFSQAGLQPGDVLVSVEGSPVMDASQAQQLIEALGEGAAMSVSVRRGKSTMEQLLLKFEIEPASPSGASLSGPLEPDR